MRVGRFRPSDQHDSEASFVSHHASVSFGSICQRNGFDHRTDLLQGWESVSSASIEEPVIVPASERTPTYEPPCQSYPSLLDCDHEERQEIARKGFCGLSRGCFAI